MQFLESGERDHPVTVGVTAANKPLNRFNNITVCEFMLGLLIIIIHCLISLSLPSSCMHPHTLCFSIIPTFHDQSTQMMIIVLYYNHSVGFLIVRETTSMHPMLMYVITLTNSLCIMKIDY